MSTQAWIMIGAAAWLTVDGLLVLWFRRTVRQAARNARARDAVMRNKPSVND